MIINLKNLKYDTHNANKGTARGKELIEKSIRKYGLGRSILIDKYNKIIAGNKTTEAADKIGIKNVKIIEDDGKALIAVKRTDLDLDKDKEARELAFADNRTTQVSLEWSPEEITIAIDGGCNLSEMFTDKELSGLLLNEDIEISEDTSEELSGIDECECPKCGYKWKK